MEPIKFYSSKNQDKAYSVCFVNTEQPPSEVIRHRVFKFKKETKNRFFELTTKIYVFEDCIRYSLLDWEEVYFNEEDHDCVVSIIQQQHLLSKIKYEEK